MSLLGMGTLIFMAELLDKINLLSNPYEEEEDILILRVTEKEIEEALQK